MNENMTPGGLIKPVFKPNVQRSLLYSPDDHRLVVVSPFFEKENLKSIGMMWHPEQPKGWSFYFSEENLRYLLESMTFSFLDGQIEKIIDQERERAVRLNTIKNLSKQNVDVCLKIPGIKTTETMFLRTYQKYGVQFIVNALGATLVGDEMGLGKGIQAIGAALWLKNNRGFQNCLVIAPASIKYNWADEIKKWTDETFAVVDGAADKRLKQWEEKTFFKIVNPEAIINDIDDVACLRLPWDMIVIDEIQIIKNLRAKRSENIRRLKTRPNGIKLGLSGTPLDGRLEELFSIFEFLTPGIFGRRFNFMMKHAIRNEYNAVIGYRGIDEIRQLMSPYFIRRLKAEVAKDLPEKIFKTVYVSFSKEERNIYNKIVKGNHDITIEAEAMIKVLRARQFCDAPGLLDEKPTLGAKYEAVLNIVREVVTNGNKVIVFTMFEQMVKLLLSGFKQEGFKCFHVTGEVKPVDRVAIAKEFNESKDVHVCVMDEAGSAGLNFQEASCVIHYDDNWAPAIMKQRTDRAHRITTKHAVTVINMVCRNTVEDRVRSKLFSKDKVSAEVLNENVYETSAIRGFSSLEMLKLL